MKKTNCTDRRSLLPREGADNELAEENFWEEMDKMCRKENHIIKASSYNYNCFPKNSDLVDYRNSFSMIRFSGVWWKTAGGSS